MNGQPRIAEDLAPVTEPVALVLSRQVRRRQQQAREQVPAGQRQLFLVEHRFGGPRSTETL